MFFLLATDETYTRTNEFGVDQYLYYLFFGEDLRIHH